MKNQVTIPVFLFALIVISSLTFSQITITSADATAINAVGNVITNQLDSTTTSIDIGSPGSTSWDFSSLNSHLSNDFSSVLPSSTPYFSSDFPTSNVAFHFNVELMGASGEGWDYSTQNAGNYEQNGEANNTVLGTDSILLKAKYSPAQLFFPLPFTFSDTWGSSFTITFTTYFNGTLFSTMVANHTETVSVDAYGQMTMPGGNVVQALRIRRDDRYTSPSPPFYVRTISYTFMGKSGAVVEVVANDTTAPNNGTIQIDGATWNNNNSSGIEGDDQAPTRYSLSQNYPNPFNPSTVINFSILKTEFISLKVFDVLGKEVATLVNEAKPAGNYRVTFDGAELPSGVYLYKLQTESFIETKKMSLIK